MEKQRRARVAKEKAEREKQERQQKKRRLLEVNAGTSFSIYLVNAFLSLLYCSVDEQSPFESVSDHSVSEIFPHFGN